MPVIWSGYKVALFTNFAMALETGNESVLKDVNYVKCALCLDIFEDPYRLPCDHVYVRDYINHRSRSVRFMYHSKMRPGPERK